MGSGSGCAGVPHTPVSEVPLSCTSASVTPSPPRHSGAKPPGVRGPDLTAMRRPVGATWARFGSHGGTMGSFSIWHWMVVLLVVLLLFGSGKVSNLMGD